MPNKKQSPAIDGKAELLTADWTLARQLFDHIKLTIRLSLAGQVFLGAELERLKKDLGFTGSGRRKKKVANLATLTWDEYLTKEMPDLPRRTADRFIAVYEAAKSKLKKLGHARALTLFDHPPHELTAAQHTQLNAITEKITDGETQASILIELKIAKAPQGSAAKGGNLGGGDEDKEEPTMEQLAFALFESPVQDLCNLRAHGDYERCLHALPLTSADPDVVTLATIEQQATSLLADVIEAKKAALQK